MSERITVVGAGVAGLVAATALAEAGRRVVVIDKGRGPGGRTSHRVRPGHRFDHGAQYFTVRDPRFRRQVESWLAAGTVARWSPRLVVYDAPGIRSVREERERFVGVPGMNAMAVDLAARLDVRSGVRVDRLVRAGDAWEVRDADGRPITEADAVLVTAPPSQAAALMGAAPALAAAAAAVVMRPCWAVLLGFAEPPAAGFDGAFVNAGPLAWVSRDSSKPGRVGGEAWVLHAAEDWSEAHLEREPGEVISVLRDAFMDLLPAATLPGITHAEAHRWRFAQPNAPLSEPCVVEASLRLGLGGDWCGGPRVEGAYLSGLALAERALAWD